MSPSIFPILEQMGFDWNTMCNEIIDQLLQPLFLIKQGPLTLTPPNVILRSFNHRLI